MHKVLIVEDEIIAAADLQELLQNLGYDVDKAHHYDEAITKAIAYKPELILCDINLNGIKNGIDLIEELRKTYRHFEVIYLTAYSSDDIISKAELTQPLNYLLKPYNDSQIEVALRLALSHAKNASRHPELSAKLSHMELKIIEYIARQKTSKEIAEQLFISEKTVRNHRYNIAKKLNLSPGNNSLSRWAISQFKA